MEFETLLNLVGDEPLFESSLLLAGDINPKIIRLQLSRWVKNGRIYQLRRGLYALAPPYQKSQPHPFLVANHLQRSSYVSLQSALAFYGMIPDIVNMTMSVTTGRPEQRATQLGVYVFRHVKTDLLFGYKMFDLGGQSALVATPEKALLDLIYFQPGSDTALFLQSLRLQNLSQLDTGLLIKQAQAFASPKMLPAAEVIAILSDSENDMYEDL